MSKLSNEEVRLNTQLARQIEDSYQEFYLDKVQFKIMSAKEIENVSVCQIMTNNSIGSGGINDPKLGPIEESFICETCFKTLECCPGHYGYIKLATPIINPEMKNIVLSILNCVCNDCSRLLVSEALIRSDKSLYNKRGLDRLSALKELSIKCGKCPRVDDKSRPCKPTPEYKVTDNKDPYLIKYKPKNSKAVAHSTNTRTIEDIYMILDNIREEDLPFLGFSKDSPHPRDFIMKNLVVPPPSCRPPLIQDGERKQDSITTSFIQILLLNKRLSNLNLTENDRKDIEKKLATTIFELISSTKETQAGKSNGSKSIRKKFNGKEGLTRKSANGKRGDFAGRTAIGGDSTLPFGWISIPREFAKVLTRKVVVTNYNIERMKKLYASGKITHNKQAEGRYAGRCMMISSMVNSALVPKLGDVLDVLMEDGDIVTFNRQPTLHRSCMMSFRVLLHDANTIKIHSSITEATNADFDGDEANIYMHQGVDTIAENYLLSNVTYNIPNFHRSGVMTSIYYHACLGAYLITSPDVILDQEDFNSALTIFDRSLSSLPINRKSIRFESYKARIKAAGIHPRSGPALFSALFPANFSLNYGGLKIESGVLLSGQVTAKSLGGFGLVHKITQNYGVHVARQFISETQWLCDWYLTIRGSSLCLADIMPPNREELREYVEETLTKTQLIVNQFYKEDISEELRENKILAALGQVDDGGKKVAMKFMNKENNYVAIYSSGAKGSANNFKCMMAMYGQEVNCGARPKFNISNQSRFCCFNGYNDIDVTARGFITQSFVDGLSPISFIMHMDSARDGINSSNLSTPESGFMGRKLNTMLRDDIISTTGEVITVNKCIMQFSYGDGMDPSKQTLAQSLELGTNKYFINVGDMIRSLIASEIQQNGLPKP